MIEKPKALLQYWKFAYGVLIVFAALDAWNFLSAKFLSAEGAFLKFSSAIRLMFELVVFYVLWKRGFRCNMRVARLARISILLAGTSSIGFLLFQANFPKAIPLANYLICLNKYLFFFIAFFFYELVKDSTDEQVYRKIFVVYEWIVSLNALLALVGFIGDIWWLRSYDDGLRWGYQGLFTFGVESSLFNVLALFYGIATWLGERRRFPYLMATISCLLSGAKAAWALMFVIHIWFLWRHYPRAGRTVLLMLITLILIFHQAIVEKIAEVPAVAFFFELSARGYPIEKIIFSSRNELMLQAMANMEYWTPWNYLFGGGGLVTWGIGLPKWQTFLTEMDVFDLPLFFGFIGSILLMYGYYLICRDVNSRYRNFFMLCLLILAGLSGHVFYSSMNALYMVLFIQKSQSAVGKNSDA